MIANWVKRFNLIYSPKRIFWLFLSGATISHITITSGELWEIMAGEISIKTNMLLVFSLFFLFLNMVIRIYSFNKTINNLYKTIVFSTLTLFVELIFFSFVLLLTLTTLNVSTTKTLNTVACIIFTTFPIALGAATMPEITDEYLEKRIFQLQRKIDGHAIILAEIEKKDEALQNSLKKMQEKRKRVVDSDKNE